MKRFFIVGAQKLYLSLGDSIKFAEQLVARTKSSELSFDVAVCPSFINLGHVADVLRGSRIALGAQNVHQESSGAFTGQVSMVELMGLGIRKVIIGHSELRSQLGETNGMIKRKVEICLKHRVTPIVCVGENRDQRAAGKSMDVIRRDVTEALSGIAFDEDGGEERLVIAYEPVWAIRGGRDDEMTRNASPELANEMHDHIRDVISGTHNPELAERIRILYGGSVDSSNTESLLKKPSINGLLVGTASISLDSFLSILNTAQAVATARLQGSLS